MRETPKVHPDHDLLAKAISSLKRIMKHIENQLAMFVLINDIENCPVSFLIRKKLNLLIL
jgi:hypothetical protein